MTRNEQLMEQSPCVFHIELADVGFEVDTVASEADTADILLIVEVAETLAIVLW